MKPKTTTSLRQSSSGDNTQHTTTPPPNLDRSSIFSEYHYKLVVGSWLHRTAPHHATPVPGTPGTSSSGPWKGRTLRKPAEEGRWSPGVESQFRFARRDCHTFAAVFIYHSGATGRDESAAHMWYVHEAPSPLSRCADGRVQVAARGLPRNKKRCTADTPPLQPLSTTSGCRRTHDTYF